MKDHGVSLNKKCSCVQKECPLWGNCVLCVQNHVEWGDHVPECFQHMMREDVAKLARLVEYRCEDKRPKEAFWQKADKDRIVRDALAKHTDEPEEDA
jgi:hypothetical protein